MLTTSADTKIELHVWDVYFRRVPFSHQPTAGRKWPVTKICFHFLKFLSLKYCFCFIWKEGLAKKILGSKMHCGGILTWQTCDSDVAITRDVKHHVLFKHKNPHLNASRSLFLCFPPNHTILVHNRKNKHANHLRTNHNLSYFLRKIFGIRACS